MSFFLVSEVAILANRHHLLFKEGEILMIKSKQLQDLGLSSEEERELELAQQREEMHKLQLSLDAYTKQQIYDYQTARDMLTEIQKRYRMYEAEEFFGTTADKATLH
jgi:hypothetical protein